MSISKADIHKHVTDHFEKDPLPCHKHGRDKHLEEKILHWITHVIHVNENPGTDFDHFLQDGSVLSKLMTSIVFNSVPMEDADQKWGSAPERERVNAVIREIKRYGVKEVFEPDDLLKLFDIPKVTRCLVELSKLAAADKDSPLNA